MVDNPGNIGVAFVGCYHEGIVEPSNGWACDQLLDTDSKQPNQIMLDNGGALQSLLWTILV